MPNVRVYLEEVVLLRKILTHPEDSNLIEILDRVLDNGIVVDPSARVLLMGTDLHTINDRVIVESVHTYV